MLPKKNRILKKKDFKKTFKEKGTKNEFFSLKFKPCRLSSTRIGIVISRKVSIKSTERNKLKRRIREIFKKLLPGINKNTDIVLNVFPKSLELGFGGIEEKITELLKKSKLLND